MPAADERTGVGPDRADRLAQRLAIPVLIAALASVPAVFLTLLDEPYETIGTGLNTVSGAVLIAETVVLFAVAENRLAWLKRNRWLVLLAVTIVPAVVFAVGPVQLLRLTRVAHALRIVGALRIVRAGRIMKAGRILRERAGLDARWQRATAVLATSLAAVFVGIILADPTSTSGGAVRSVVDVVGIAGIILAGVLLGGATFIVRANRRQAGEEREIEAERPTASPRKDELDDERGATDDQSCGASG